MNAPMKAPNKDVKPEDRALALLSDPVMVKQIANALPKHFEPSRMIRIVTTELRKNKKLRECDPMSFIACVIQCAQLGLEPGSGLQHAFLVPYGKECTLIPGYKGLAELSRRSGKVDGLYADLVFPGDPFAHGVRSGIPFLDHKPSDEYQPAEKMTHVYAIATFASGQAQHNVMRKGEVDKIRDGLRYVSDVWKQHYGEMAKKTAFRRLAKLLPQSPEFVKLQELDDAANAGTQMRMVLEPLIEKGVIDANYDPEPEKQAPLETPRDKEQKGKQRHDIVGEFRDAYNRAKAAGLSLGDAFKMLGAEAAQVEKAPVDEIETAIDILNDWLKKKGVS